MLVLAFSLVALQAVSVSARLHTRYRSNQTQAIASSSDGIYALSSYKSPVAGNGSAPANASTWQLTINDTPSGYKQQVTGFGAAVTDATVSVFNSLSNSTLDKLLHTLMTPDGINFSLMRHTIGASDLTGDPVYTYDDGAADPTLSNFNLQDRGRQMASLLAKLKQYQRQLTVLGSSWSPPGWMQLDGEVVGNDDSNNTLNAQYVDSFGHYFVDYIRAFEAAGVEIDAITIQNEPLNSNADYPTMHVSADQSWQWIKNHIGPALRSAGLNTKIWAYDHNTDVPEYPQKVIDLAAEYVDTVAWHCYASDNDWTSLTSFHETNPTAIQYMTECWTSNETSWNQAADFTMGPLQNWASGAMAWTLATNSAYGPHLSSGGCATCRGLVVVNNNGTYDFTVDYYMMGQFSKYIPRGATVLDGSGSYTYSDGTGIESVATLNPDGTRTVVIKNAFANDVYIHLSTQSGEYWSGWVYQNSVVTWLLPA